MPCFGYLGDLGDKNVALPSSFDAQSPGLLHVSPKQMFVRSVKVIQQTLPTVLSSFDKDQLEYEKAIEDIAPQSGEILLTFVWWGAPYNPL